MRCALCNGTCAVPKYRAFKDVYQLITNSQAQYLSCFLCTLAYKVAFRQTPWEVRKWCYPALPGGKTAGTKLARLSDFSVSPQHTCPSASTFQIMPVICFSMTRPSSQCERLYTKKSNPERVSLLSLGSSALQVIEPK